MMLDFQQESPYFHEQLQENISACHATASRLKSITNEIERFTQLSRALAQSGQSLSAQLSNMMVKQPPPGDIEGIDSYSLAATRQLSVILSEISSTTDTLSESLNHAMLQPLEMIVNSRELQEIDRMNENYLQGKVEHERLLKSYLQSDLQKNRGSDIESRALELVKHFKHVELQRFDSIFRLNAYNQKVSLELGEACTCATMGLRNFIKSSEEVLNNTKSTTIDAANNLSMKMGEYKKKFLSEQVTMGRMRGDLVSLLDSIVERVSFQTPSEVPGTSLGGGGDQVLSMIDTPFRDSTYFPPAPTNSSGGGLGIARSLMSFGSAIVGMGTSDSSFASANGLGGGKGDSDLPPAAADSLSEVELRVKALELPHELASLYSSMEKHQFFSSNVRKQGFLFLNNGKLPTRGKSIGRQVSNLGWRREWVVLDDSKLYCIREGFAMEQLVNLEVCSVRDRSAEFAFCLEIANANKSTVTLLFEGHREFSDWLACLKISIEDRLGSRGHYTTRIPKNNSSSGVSNLAVSHGATASERSMTTRAMIDRLTHSAAEVCMDCRSPQQTLTWVSLNCATLLCIDCSGVHRSLGSHISKVRSLMLDDLFDAEYEYLVEMICEQRVNQNVWESSPDNAPSRDQTWSRDLREHMIRQKYAGKAFMRRITTDIRLGEEGGRAKQKALAQSLDDELFQAVRSQNSALAMLCMQQGAGAGRLNEVLRFACQINAAHVVVMVILHGGSIEEQLDITTAIDIAIQAGNNEIADYLQRKCF